MTLSEPETTERDAAAILPTMRPAADSAADKAPCQFVLVTGRLAFEALGPEWRDLFERGGQPHQVFQTFDWLRLWSNHYLSVGESLAIVVGRCDGRLALVWPLVSRRIGGVRALMSMGEPVGQYGDALVETRPDADDLVAAALGFAMTLPVDLLWLRRVRDDAAVAPILKRHAKSVGPLLQAPYVDFAGVKDVAAFDMRFTTKQRSDRRRHWRRLEDIGPACFETHATGERARDLARLAISFKRDWAVQSGRLAPTLFDPRLEDFFAAAAAYGEHGPPLRVSALLCAGEPIGVAISLVCNNWMFGHMLAVRPGFGKQGAGVVLAGRSIAGALEDGYRGFDLLAPADPYKLDWTGRSVEVRDFALCRTLAGRIFKMAWIDFGREAGKRLAKRLPPRLGRLMIGGMG
jgi:CelD/BcsL family acetyltransferase involved in cellulose biosynthesis